MNAILSHDDRSVLPFYTPGHKNGGSMDPNFRAAYSQRPLAFDLGFMGAFDDLHAPSGIIAAAESAASQLYGSAHSFLLTNGSTCGIIAALLAILAPGDTIILPRNVHRCVMTALILGDFVPAFVDVGLEEVTGLPLPLHAGAIPSRLWEEAQAILVTSPTYHGIASDLRPLASEARRHGVYLVVDEAHGAHFPFDPRLPAPALHSGAHVAIQSTHKTLQAITPGAMLHLAADGPDPARIRQALRMTQTSSANYAVLASLDASVRYMAEEGPRHLSDAIDAVLLLQQSFADSREMVVPRAGRDVPHGVNGIDPTKLVVDFRPIGLTGFEAARLLLEEERIGVELATHSSVLLIVTAADSAGRLEELGRRLGAFASRHAALRAPLQAEAAQPPCIVGATATTPREAFFAAHIRVPWEQATGRVAAESIVPYPPGVPAIWPGERFQGDILAFRSWLRSCGASVQASDPDLESVLVLA